MLPQDSTLILRHVSWAEYEALLTSVPEAPGLRLSYDRGTLQVMTLSSEHENYARLLDRIVERLSAIRRIRVLFFGSSTIKKKPAQKGIEPDACFYVQTAAAVGSRIQLDFGVDPPPDVVVEIDVHHESLSKFPIYAALGVSEIWRYDGRALGIHLLRDGEYVAVESSLAFPMLSGSVLTGFLNQSPAKDQHEILLAFEQWLETARA